MTRGGSNATTRLAIEGVANPAGAVNGGMPRWVGKHCEHGFGRCADRGRRADGFLGHGGWPPPGRRRILSRVLARVRKWFDGAGWFVGAAVVLLVFALLAALAGLQSSDSILWTGQQVTGTEQQGLVYYRWQGQSYSLDVPGSGSSKAVSVYLNPGDPSQAIVDNVLDRVLAGLLVLGPTTGAVVLLVLGGTRNYRWQRRKLKRAREFRL